MNVLRPFLGLSALFAIIACGPKDRPSTAPAPAAPSDGGTTSAAGGLDAGPPVDLHGESEIALRTRVLAALDAGDIIATDRALREIVRRRSTAIGARGIIDALETCALKDNLKNCNLANVTTVEASALPAPSANVPKDKSGRFVAKPMPRDDAEPNQEKAAFETNKPPSISYVQRTFAHRLRSMPGMPKEKADWLPSELGDSALVRIKWTGQRWLAIYGRAYNDGRFVAIIDPKGQPIRIVDFKNWRAHNALVEVGIHAADMIGETLYVKQEANASDGFLAAVDTTTGKTLWQTEKIGMSSRPVVGEDHVVIWTYSGAPINGTPVPQGFRLYDRATGEIVARIPTTYVVGTMLAGDGSITAYGGGPGLEKTNRVEINTRAKKVPEPPPTPEPPKEGTIRLASLKVADPAVAKARLDAFGLLDEGKTLEALVALRDVFDKLPSSLAAEALFDAAREDAAEQREAARADMQAKPGTTPVTVSIAAFSKKRPAPIPRTRPKAPKLRLIDEAETRKHRSAWFFDAKIPATTYEQDERPNGIPIVPSPLWLPPGRSMDVVTPKGDQTVAVYSGMIIAVWRADKFVTQVILDRTGGGYRVAKFADVIGNVVVAAVTEPKGGGSLLAADLQNGSVFWKTDNLPISSFVFEGGYIIANTDDSGKKQEVVIIEGDTGKVVSRTTTPKGMTGFPSRLAAWNNVLWQFNDINTARFNIE